MVEQKKAEEAEFAVKLAGKESASTDASENKKSPVLGKRVPERNAF